MSISKPIASLIVETAVFLEFSDESVIDPDSAITFMERMACLIGELEPSEREELNALLPEIALGYYDEETRKFIRELGVHFGFWDEERFKSES